MNCEFKENSKGYECYIYVKAPYLCNICKKQIIICLLCWHDWFYSRHEQIYCNECNKKIVNLDNYLFFTLIIFLFFSFFFFLFFLFF